MQKLKVLDLFSGIGGFSLGLERTGGFETVAFCEIDPFCQKVLKKHWPDVPIYNDVRTLNYDGPVDVITGGYPCQPFSTAGKRKGADDDRHLWPAMFSLIQKHRPAWVVGENVAGHISMGLDNVLADLESADYGARTFVIPACAVDAKHRRDRTWVVANSESAGKRREIGNLCQEDGGPWGTLFQQQLDGTSEGAAKIMEYADSVGTQGPRTEQPTTRTMQRSENVSHASSQGWERGEETRNKNCGGAWIKQLIAGCSGISKRTWPPEPAVGRVAHGIPRRVDRLKSLGNAVVPQIPEMIGYAILTTTTKQYNPESPTNG